MKTPKKPGTKKAKSRKLKLKRQTVGDLDVRSKGKDVKGGCSITVIQSTCILCHPK